MSKKHSWAFYHRRKRENSNTENFHPEAKRAAHLRLAILKMLHKELSKGEGLKEKIIEGFVQVYNSGMVLPETFTKPEHISRSTLYSWGKKYRNGGFVALLPRYKWGPKPGAAVVPIRPLSRYTKIVISGPPKRSAKYEFYPHLRRQWKGPPLDCPIRLGIVYCMPIRKGTKMPRRMRMLKHRISHIGKPNLDTLNAFIVDCLTGICFKDRSQIIQFYSKKEFEWWPEIRIYIRALSG
jgi:Holliday junction resolvase RusA-like endonuclease